MALSGAAAVLVYELLLKPRNRNQEPKDVMATNEFAERNKIEEKLQWLKDLKDG